MGRQEQRPLRAGSGHNHDIQLTASDDDLKGNIGAKSMTENASGLLESPASRNHSLGRWTGQVPRDVVLIVLGAVLAFGGEQVRDARHRRAHVEASLLGIRDELRANAALVTHARDHHAFLADTLAKLVASHRLPGVEIYSNGMFNPALVTSTAWQAARETGTLGDIPLTTVLTVAPAYEAQASYRSLAEAMGTAIMTDVRRDGMSTVLRDRFGQFVPLDVDFAHREAILLGHYQKALAVLDRHH